jgi:tRNA(Leu) C34 or U34 (ribose-2'-O)-methylase TrmL
MIIGKRAPTVGIAPAIVLENPRFAFNVGMVVRLASCYGLDQVWYTGDRVALEIERKKRLPREERMKGYKDVRIVQFDRPLEQFPEGVVPVAVELRPNSERLPDFVHPEHAIYVFGPEDGSISGTLLSKCHRFLVVPVRHCLNLATAVATILYDRSLKSGVGFTDPSEKVYEDTDPAKMGLFDDRAWPRHVG